ncbi:MAG: hypothetical protein WCC57_04830, partial [Paracoccaceae bacterium]
VFGCALLATSRDATAQIAFAGSGYNAASQGTKRPQTLVLEPRLRDLRRKMVAGGILTNAQLRELADTGDGLSAFNYAKRLDAIGRPDLIDDSVHYFAIAAYSGRSFAVRRLITLLQTDGLTLSASRAKGAHDALATQAKSGNEAAALGLSALYFKGTPFGKDTQLGRDYLAIAARNGSGGAAVQLGLSYMTATPDAPADPDRARIYLDMALASPDLSAKTIAASLMHRLPPPAVPLTAPADAAPTNSATESIVAVASATDAPTLRPRHRPLREPMLRPQPRPASLVTTVSSAPPLSSDQGVTQ